MNEPSANLSNMDPQTLNLRDIHLPDPISWWPIAPGWWMIIASLILVVVILFITKKMYANRQLQRDIRAELDDIKQQFQTTHNKVQLAKTLSILLRRASISYYPEKDIAGLIGNHWLTYLDNTITRRSAGIKFNSDVGKVLLSAPYLPEDADLEFEAQSLITLCESWLNSSHKSASKKTATTPLSPVTSR